MKLAGRPLELNGLKKRWQKTRVAKEGGDLFQSSSGYKVIYATVANLAKNDILIDKATQNLADTEDCPLPGVALRCIGIKEGYDKLGKEVSTVMLNGQAWALKRLLKMVRDKATVRQNLPKVRYLVCCPSASLVRFGFV